MGRVTVHVFGFFILLLFESKCGMTVEVSKACYGSMGLQCTRHILMCSSGRIAIQDAFYMIGSDCGLGVSHCGDTNLTGIHLTGTRYNFSDTELDSLYGKCSTQPTCNLPAGRSIPAWFSTVIYRCIDVEVSKACYGTPGLTCTTHSLRCSSGPIAIQEAFYMESTACDSAVSDCANISLRSIPLTGKKYNFSDEEVDSLHRECSTQSTCSLRGGRWTFMSFSAIIYECNFASSLKTTTPKTTLSKRRQGTTPTLTSLTTARSSSVVQPEQTIITELGTGGIFAAGLFTGLAIATVMVGVVYFFYIRRRCVIKKPDPGPASPNHLTYTGLTDLGRPDTYDVINRPEAVTSETSQAPVYQNVNDAS